MSARDTAPTSPRGHPDPRVAAVVAFFEDLSPADLDRLDRVYCEDAFFKDPFNEVRGTAAIRRIFAHMYAQLQTPHFVVEHAVVEGHTCFVDWQFRFRAARLGPQEQVVRGASRLDFDPASGKVRLHRDYWDAAEELYAKLPLLGALMRWLRRRGSADPG